MDSNAKQRFKAQSSTAFGNLTSKTDPLTKRMAGMALLGGVAPGLIALVDDRESSLTDQILSGAIGAASIGAGGYFGYRDGHIPAGMIDQYKRDQMSEFKAEVKDLMRTDPEKARDVLAELKGKMNADLEPIDPKRAKVLNAMFNQMGEIGEPLAAMDLANRTPRELRGATRGAMIGALASAIPAYLALRGEPVE